MPHLIQKALKQNSVSPVEALARDLFVQSKISHHAHEKVFAHIQKMLSQNKHLRACLVEFMDALFHIQNTDTAIKYIRKILRKYQGKRAFSPLMKLFVLKFLFFTTIPFFNILFLFWIKRLILFFLKPVMCQSVQLPAILDQSKKKNQPIIINYLGEKVLSKHDCDVMLANYIQHIQNPNVEALSIKLSSLCLHLSSLTYKSSVKKMKQALTSLADELVSEYEIGHKVLLYVDMEFYDHLAISVTAFSDVFALEKYSHINVGIVLQAYFKESMYWLDKLVCFSKSRVVGGGTKLRIRLVKGANIALEHIICDQNSWSKPTWPSKAATDSQFKNLILKICSEELTNYIQLSVASHNIFDISFALIHAYQSNALSDLRLELLAGMMPATARVLHQEFNLTWIYYPVASEMSLQHCIPYLFRRLDENSQDGHFLKDLPQLKVGNRAWLKQLDSFSKSIDYKVCHKPLMNQDGFKNIANTDWSVHSKLVELTNAMSKPDFYPVIHSKLSKSISKSYEFETKGVFPDCLHSTSYIQKTLSAFACDDIITGAESMSKTKSALRIDLVLKAAEYIQRKRNQLIVGLVNDIAKPVSEADKEISEAIDFCNYYVETYTKHLENPFLDIQPIGPTLICAPWNFPCAITTGMLVSNLLVGNPVILKPSPYSVLATYLLCECFWEAGVSKEALQFVIATDDDLGTALVKDKRIKQIYLTGSSKTAQWLLNMRPDVAFVAETGGKNTMILSDKLDIDLAVEHLVYSAFGYSGQKCSAASLCIASKQLLYKTNFLDRLNDAVLSLRVGKAQDFETDVVPLISIPNERLSHVIDNQKLQQNWLVKPQQKTGFDNLYSPGVLLGVKQEDFYFKTECFGPVLGIVESENLMDSIRFANSSKYGLTAGFQGLCSDEQLVWKTHIQAGNLYVNRPTTGAIVDLQPFGGVKQSRFGKGMKAGGPYYTLQAAKVLNKPFNLRFSNIKTIKCSSWIQKLIEQSNLKLQETFELEYWSECLNKDLICLEKEVATQERQGQKNTYYLKLKHQMAIRVEKQASLLEVLKLFMFCDFIKHSWILSIEREHILLTNKGDILKGWKQESKAAFLESLALPNSSCIRVIGNADKEYCFDFSSRGYVFKFGDFLLDLQAELRHYVDEVSYSAYTHRYGHSILE